MEAQLNDFNFQLQQLQQQQQQLQQLQQQQLQPSQYNNGNSSNPPNQGSRGPRSHPYEQRGDRGRNRPSGSSGGSGGRVNSGGGGGGGNKGRTGPMRRGGNFGSNQSFDDNDRDRRGDKVERERPSRTLFVRNINYSVSESTIREMFEQYGEIKRFFNLIEKRGMCFVTYVSISS